MTDILDGLSEDEQALVAEWSIKAPQKLIDRLNWGLDAHPSNWRSRRDCIYESDVEERLSWARTMLAKLGKVPALEEE